MSTHDHFSHHICCSKMQSMSTNDCDNTSWFFTSLKEIQIDSVPSQKHFFLFYFILSNLSLNSHLTDPPISNCQFILHIVTKEVINLILALAKISNDIPHYMQNQFQFSSLTFMFWHELVYFSHLFLLYINTLTILYDICVFCFCMHAFYSCWSFFLLHNFHMLNFYAYPKELLKFCLLQKTFIHL